MISVVVVEVADTEAAVEADEVEVVSNSIN